MEGKGRQNERHDLQQHLLLAVRLGQVFRPNLAVLIDLDAEDSDQESAVGEEVNDPLGNAREGFETNPTRGISFG